MEISGGCAGEGHDEKFQISTIRKVFHNLELPLAGLTQCNRKLKFKKIYFRRPLLFTVGLQTVEATGWSDIHVIITCANRVGGYFEQPYLTRPFLNHRLPEKVKEGRTPCYLSCVKTKAIVKIKPCRFPVAEDANGRWCFACMMALTQFNFILYYTFNKTVPK